MNVHCLKNLCDNNTGFTHECMFGITEDVIRKAKEENSSMCPILRKEVMEVYNEVAKVVVSEIVEKLENLYPVNPYTNDFSNGRDYANGQAIKVAKKVGGLNETN